MESLLDGVTKDWLVTDECCDRPRSSGSAVPSGPSGACNPFEVEPGHFDFLPVAESYSSRQFSSDPGSSKGSSTKSDSSNSVTRRYSNQSASSSGSGGNLRLSQFMSDWVEQPFIGSAQEQGDVLAIEYPIESANTFSKPSASRVGAHRNRAGGAHRSRASRSEAQPSRAEAQPAHRVSAHPFLESYSWDEVVAMTKAANNHLLGKGGFGPVYMGILPSNKPVAVKILDDGSRQGDSEFINEVDLLSRVNHVNLVKLIGYCQEASDRVLVYEHAEKGTLWDHIHGSSRGFLDWRTRLKVSLESACGLEYLHTGCCPMIIHRDIKSSNILLTKSFVAKVADFGLSKLGLEDDGGNATHISTVVKGTPGYLDPEYYKTGQLNEKSDVYSFGVVLLEVITGRHPIERDADIKFIGDWVKAQWKSNGAKGVVDSRLGGTYNLKSVKAIVTLALKCVESAAKSRPNVRTVVEQLRAAIVLEDNTQQTLKWSLKSLLGQG